MFKFNFDVEDAEAFNDLALDNLEFGQGSQSSLQSESEPFTEHTLNRLVRHQSIFLTATIPLKKRIT